MPRRAENAFAKGGASDGGPLWRRWASSSVMSVRPVGRSRRPAACGAGRALANAMLALAVIVLLVFAHGGACAALIVSEQGAHAVHAAPAVPSFSPVVDCEHDDLPPHRHGAEQDASVADPSRAAVAIGVQNRVPAVVTDSVGRRTPPVRSGPVPRPAPDLVNICVMRV